MILLGFANGRIGVIDNSRKAVYDYNQRKVFGSRGVARAENKTPDTAIQDDAASVRFALPLHFFVERHAEASVEEMCVFEVVLQDTPPPYTGTDARAPVVISQGP